MRVQNFVCILFPFDLAALPAAQFLDRALPEAPLYTQLLIAWNNKSSGIYIKVLVRINAQVNLDRMR